MMDPITLWTALGVITVVVGGIIGAIRKSDKDLADTRFVSLETKVSDLTTSTSAKLDKEEFFRFGDRIDKDIEQLRTEQKTGNDRLYAELKDFRLEVLEAIKEIRSK
jgi:hypothetical protein